MASTARRTTHAPPAPGSAAWKRLVTAGKKAAAENAAATWKLGDLALEVVPWVGPGVGSNAHQSRGTIEALGQYAEEVGVALGALQSYRTTAHHWPPKTRVRGVSFDAHRVLNGRPEMMERLLKRHGGHVTVKQATAARGWGQEGRELPNVIEQLAERPVFPGEPPTAAGKLEEMLAARPEMAQAVVSGLIERGVAEPPPAPEPEPDDDEPEEPEEPQAKRRRQQTPAEELGLDDRPFQLVYCLGGALSSLRSALTLASQHDIDLGERYQAEAESQLTRLRDLLGLLESAVAGETGTDWDAEFARLTAEVE